MYIEVLLNYLSNNKQMIIIFHIFFFELLKNILKFISKSFFPFYLVTNIVIADLLEIYNKCFQTDEKLIQTSTDCQF